MQGRNQSTSLRRPSSKRAPRKPNTMARILHPLDVSEFLSAYFESRPLVVRGKRKKFDHVLAAEEFKIGLDRVTEIRAVFAGLWQATIDPVDIEEMINA